MKLLRGLIAVVSLGLSAAEAVADKPELRILDPMQFRVDGNNMSFIVFAGKIPARGLQVVVRDLKDPQLKVVSPSVFEVQYERSTVDTTGSRVTLKAPAAAFPMVGDYKATLVVSAVDAVALTPVATFTRPKPEIGATGLKDNGIVLRRHWPGESLQGLRKIELENRGTTPLEAVVVRGGAVLIEGDPKRISNGTVTPLVPVRKTEQHASMTLEPGVNDLRIYFANFDAAGTYQARLWVRPAASGPEEIPFKIIVTDSWLLPTLVIALGVGIALLVSELATRTRPREENRLALLELRDLVATMRGSTVNPNRRDAVDALDAKLRRAERSLERGTAAATVTADLNALRTETAALQKELAEESRDARRTLEEAEQALAQLETAVDPAEKVRLAALQTRLAEARAKLEETDFARAKAIAQDILTQKNTIKVVAPSVTAEDRVRRGARGGFRMPAAEGSIGIVEPDAAWVSGRELTFLAPKGGGSEFVWDFGDQSPPISGERVSHRFEVAGTYVVTVSVRSGTAEVAKAVQEIRIELSPLERGYEKATKRRRGIDWALAIISLVVATVTGLSMLYSNRVFGTMANYLEAFVWGFGIDSSVRGLAAVAKKLAPE